MARRNKELVLVMRKSLIALVPLVLAALVPPALQAQAPTPTPTPVIAYVVPVVEARTGVNGLRFDIVVSTRPASFEIQFRRKGTTNWVTSPIAVSSATPGRTPVRIAGSTVSGAFALVGPYEVQARSVDNGGNKSEWSAVVIAASVNPRIYNFRVYTNVARPGDALFLGNYSILPVEDATAVDLQVRLESRTDSPRRYTIRAWNSVPAFYTALPNQSGCQGFTSADQPCAPADGLGIGAFSLYLAQAESSATYVARFVESGGDGFIVNDSVASARASGQLQGDLISMFDALGARWNEVLVSDDRTTALGTLFLAELLHNPSAFNLTLQPSFTLQPDVQPTPTIATGSLAMNAPALGSAFDQPVANLTTRTGLPGGFITALFVAGMFIIGAFFAVRMFGQRALAALPMVGLVVILPIAGVAGWVPIAIAIIVVFVVAGYGLFRRIRGDISA